MCSKCNEERDNGIEKMIEEGSQIGDVRVAGGAEGDEDGAEEEVADVARAEEHAEDGREREGDEYGRQIEMKKRVGNTGNVYDIEGRENGAENEEVRITSHGER